METGFCRWMRAQPNLDSAKEIIRSDQDHIVMRFKTAHGRSVQLMMRIEVKDMAANQIARSSIFWRWRIKLHISAPEEHVRSARMA